MPRIGYKHTLETRKKLSESHKGKKPSVETILKISLSNKGHLVSEETRKKIGQAHKGRKFSVERCQRLSEQRKGCLGRNKGEHWKLSDQTKNNISKGHKGINTWMKGRKMSEETKKKLSESHKGAKNYRWKGGYENKLMLNRKRRALKLGSEGEHSLGEWEHLKALYNWTCPACWKKEPNIILSEDHIIPLTKGGSDWIENIQPLCGSCNSKKSNKIIKYHVK